MSDEDEDGDYESGPFCEHWDDAGSCEESCAKCGHACRKHFDGSCDYCKCEKFMNRAIKQRADVEAELAEELNNAEPLANIRKRVKKTERRWEVRCDCPKCVIYGPLSVPKYPGSIDGDPTELDRLREENARLKAAVEGARKLMPVPDGQGILILKHTWFSHDGITRCDASTKDYREMFYRKNPFAKAYTEWISLVTEWLAANPEEK